MIKQLIFKGHPTVPDTTVTFANGFNLIHAPNGRGKSTVLELIAYSLFGTEALRASAGAEYPDLNTSLFFDVKGKTYFVERCKKQVRLACNNEVLAVGTTPVNAAILRLFGYNSKVYNVANYVRQSHVQALTHVLRADDRRQVLENTIGLTVIDKVVKELTDAVKGFEGEIKGLEAALSVELAEPIPPEGYYEDRTEDLGNTLAAYRRYNQLIGQIQQVSEPIEPDAAEVSVEDIKKLNSEIDELKKLQYTYHQMCLEVSRLTRRVAEKPNVGPYVDLIDLDLENIESEAEYYEGILAKADTLNREWASIILPTLSEDEIKMAATEWQVYKDWLEYQKLLKSEKVDCPNCGTHFCVNHKELSQFIDFTPETVIEKPAISEKTLWAESVLWADNVPKQRRILDEINTYASVVERAKNFFQQFPRKSHEYAKAKLVIQLYQDWVAEDYEAKLKEAETVLAAAKDFSKEIEKLEYQRTVAMQNQLKWATYKERLANYAKTVANNNDVRVQLDALGNAEANYKAYTLFDKSCDAYEKELASYKNQLAQRENLSVKLKELTDKVADHKLGVNGLKEAKKEIKNYLLPSLNLAASALVQVMSNSVIEAVQMLDDFSIKAKKGNRLRAVETFSGSECSVINLALRIALGQVLTHSVFSVLIGDEIDASMDKDRTAAVWEALSRLSESGKVKQIILVSHEQEPINIRGLNYVNFT